MSSSRLTRKVSGSFVCRVLLFISHGRIIVICDTTVRKTLEV